MPSIERPLSGDVLVFDLTQERARIQDVDAFARSGRGARTLSRMGPLRVTLVALAPGGELSEHQAEGPVTVLPLEGHIRIRVGDTFQELAPGQLLSLGPGVRHAVASPAGASFLLTVATEKN